MYYLKSRLINRSRQPNDLFVSIFSSFLFSHRQTKISLAFDRLDLYHHRHQQHQQVLFLVFALKGQK